MLVRLRKSVHLSTNVHQSVLFFCREEIRIQLVFHTPGYVFVSLLGLMSTVTRACVLFMPRSGQLDKYAIVNMINDIMRANNEHHIIISNRKG